MSKIVWGPEIAIDGKRPEWLEGYDGPVRWFNCDQRFGVTLLKSDRLNWGNYYGMEKGAIHAIRLPADHPHYATLSTPIPPNTPVGYSDEVVERISRVLRAYARNDPSLILTGNSIAAELYALADLLPEPVDADLLEAEKHLSNLAWTEDGAREGDRKSVAEHIAWGIKRGRALAAEGK